jgi:hypothetical protein
VNKVALDEQKLSLDKNAQMMEFAKIFGIPERIEPIIVSGEEGDTDVELGPPEGTGDKPTGSQ